MNYFSTFCRRKIRRARVTIVAAISPTVQSRLCCKGRVIQARIDEWTISGWTVVARLKQILLVRSRLSTKIRARLV